MVTIKLLQAPEVLVDDVPVSFPYKKAEALFYYIAAEKNITRDTAVGLLWEDNDEATAKKNLRHALYIIKKTFGFDIITSEKYKLELNPETDVKIDLDDFLNNNRLELYYGGFLKGFTVKNAYSYEEWLTQKQYSIKETYLSQLYKETAALPYSSLSEIEKNCSLYMDIDNLDERIYNILMEAYYENGFYHKGIKLYQRLKGVLEDNLGITPNKTITALYHKLLNKWSENSTADTETAPEPNTKNITRETELSQISHYYNRFLNGSAANIMLVGENGIGKTHLVQTFLSNIDNDNILILQTACFQAEKNFSLQPLNNIIMQLEDYIINEKIQLPEGVINAVSKIFPHFLDASQVSGESYNYAYSKSSFVRLFQIVAKHTPILLFIDNINAIDSASTQLILDVIRTHNPNIMLICTCLDSVDYDMVTFISTLTKDNLLVQIPVSKLTRDEAADYIKSNLGENKIDEKTIDNIFNETDGNMFFLSEVVNNIKNNTNPYELSLTAQEILNDRLNGISREARQLLDIISIFLDQSTLENLSEMQNQDKLYTLSLIEELTDRALIVEKNSDKNSYFIFRHNKMRDFVYQKLSNSKLRILHNKVADVLEQHIIKPENVWYKRLIYHYDLGENTEKTLYYKILNLEKYSNAIFELYPVFDDFDSELRGIEEISAYFKQLETELEDYNRTAKSFELYDELIARLLLSESRYFIQIGYYERGLSCIHTALENNYVKNNYELHLKFLKQKIYYGIQICDVELIDNCTKEGLTLSRTIDSNVEHAIFHRLRGFYFILKCDYRQAIANLIKSIDFLEISNPATQIYNINIAAAYNYLGELHRKQMHFSEAVNYYKKAIELMNSKNVALNPTFYTNLGRTYFDMKEYSLSYKYIKEAYTYYKDSSVLVGKSTTLAYMALYSCIMDENFECADKYIAEAEKTAKTINSPLEKGIVRYIENILSENYADKLEFIIQSPEFYKTECENYFKPFNENYFLHTALI